MSVSGTQMTVQPIPAHIDPPLYRVYKRLINTYFTPAAVAPCEEPTRALVTRLFDQSIEAGTCDFLTEFARPFPARASGAGPHRCAGSNLARLNLRLAVEELVLRLQDTRLLGPAETLPFHSALNRSPLSVPISFTPGPQSGAA